MATTLTLHPLAWTYGCLDGSVGYERRVPRPLVMARDAYLAPTACVRRISYTALPKYTLYTLVVVDVTEFFVLKKRYSQFYALRKALRRRYARAPPAIRALLQPVLDTAFPQRYLGHDDVLIRLERQRGFRDLMAPLLLLRRRLPATDGIAAVIEAFFDDTPTRDSVHTASAAGCKDACAICLDPLDPKWIDNPWYARGMRRLQLPCGHELHEDCVAPWLERQTTCPLCRVQASSGRVR
ncbi:hypothetical protein SPRG_12575 [Saprolegnia parasitica CBS 223.65]|uniref:RING-type domain-containing protein n=1 Tax=Saprolegnia parasitica (strain CBS 223.65) TaxID=695850 RepID=A0A067C0G2_SAPPC|nr:hypothetical protein SPRG_12575 [Saprolegnia parasitica CBS 223.65]KDO22595.1 hypothetical protein SPRG_12575 [Saprolegnia parasitica CBS 223.65]|eukprot:XP_012206711.1 hypothetical protein SPRG_12575 [Saprolegnia parasitica CBS 223.65]